MRHVNRRHVLESPVSVPLGPRLGVMAWDSWQLKLWVLLLLLHQLFQVDAELRVQILRLGSENVVVKASFLHYVSSSFHRNPDAQVHPQDLAEESSAHNIRFHSY